MATSPSPSTARFALSERARTLLMRFLVFPFYFLCCFFSSAYETFPYERVRDFAIHAIEAQVPGSEVDIVSLEPAWISGVEAQGVRIRLPQGPDEERRAELTIPRIYARAGILAYLFGTTDVTFEIETDGGGTITGEVTDSRSGSGEDEHQLTHVVARIEHVDLRRIGVIRHSLGLPVEGIVAGDVDVTLSDELAQTTGHVTLTIDEEQVKVGSENISFLSKSWMHSLRASMRDVLRLDEATTKQLYVGLRVAPEVTVERLTEVLGTADGMCEVGEDCGLPGLGIHFVVLD